MFWFYGRFGTSTKQREIIIIIWLIHYKNVLLYAADMGKTHGCVEDHVCGITSSNVPDFGKLYIYIILYYIYIYNICIHTVYYIFKLKYINLLNLLEN